MPRKPLVRTSLLNGNSPPIRIGDVEMFRASSHPRPARDQAVCWQFPTFPRRGHDNRLTTDSVASSSMCGSRAGLHSAGGTATNTGDRVMWEELTTTHVLPPSSRCTVQNRLMPSSCCRAQLLSGSRFWSSPDATRFLRTSTKPFEQRFHPCWLI